MRSRLARRFKKGRFEEERLSGLDSRYRGSQRVSSKLHTANNHCFG
jgi:hypothetical protein